MVELAAVMRHVALTEYKSYGLTKEEAQEVTAFVVAENGDSLWPRQGGFRTLCEQAFPDFINGKRDAPKSTGRNSFGRESTVPPSLKAGNAAPSDCNRWRVRSTLQPGGELLARTSGSPAPWGKVERRGTVQVGLLRPAEGIQGKWPVCSDAEAPSGAGSVIRPWQRRHRGGGICGSGVRLSFPKYTQNVAAQFTERFHAGSRTPHRVQTACGLQPASTRSGSAPGTSRRSQIRRLGDFSCTRASSRFHYQPERRTRCPIASQLASIWNCSLLAMC